MFELNSQIENWRSNLAQQQSFENTDIDELENHLREEIERLAESELTEEEAFMVAAHRLGRSDSLSEEFAKVNTSLFWRKRLFLVGAVVFGWLIVNYFGQVVSRVCQILAVFIGLRGYTLNAIDILSQVTFISVVVFVLYHVSRAKSIHRDKLFKIADSFRGKLVLFIVVFIIVAGTFAINMLSSIISVRLLSPQELGQMSMVKVFQELVWSIFLPLVLLLGTILVRPPKYRKLKG